MVLEYWYFRALLSDPALYQLPLALAFARSVVWLMISPARNHRWSEGIARSW
jgi:hypothetical protein